MILSKIINLRRQEFRALIKLSLIALLLVICRLILPNHRSLGFLIYNLFLAFIPLIISTYIRYYSSKKNTKLSNLICGIIWLIFFPNAPYILTDGLHVIGPSSAYVVIDVAIWIYILLIAFWIALLSLDDIETILMKQVKNRLFVHVLVALIILISAYGIYLGRDLRLNSWDIILRPYSLIEFIYQSFANETPGFFNWNAVVFYSIIIYLGYLIHIRNQKDKVEAD